MPNRKNRIPAYCHHKASGQAVVRLANRDIYLGRHGSAESREKYKRVIAQLVASANDTAASPGRSSPTETRICELFLAYLEYAEGYYVKNGKPTGETLNMKHAMRPVVELYGSCLVDEFGPLALKQAREQMIEQNLSRKVINGRVNRIRRIFKWGVENQMIEPAVLQALQAVAPLKSGRSQARETESVRPIPIEHAEAVRPLVSRQVSAMIGVQLLTGMRPGEVVLMRTCDLDMSGRIWIYRPQTHKTEHHGIERLIYLGPKAQKVVRPFLIAHAQAYLFRPIDAIKDLHRLRRNSAKSSGNPKRHRKRKPLKRPGEHYTTQSYCYAIHKACKIAGVPCWGPNRLRHTAATNLRKEFGIEAARVILGHTSAAMTEVYAEMDHAKAAEIMGQIG